MSLQLPASDKTKGKLRMKVCSTDEKYCNPERTYIRLKKGKDGIMYVMEHPTGAIKFTCESKTNALRDKKILKDEKDGKGVLNMKKAKLAISTSFSIHAGDHSEREIGKVVILTTPSTVKYTINFTDMLSKVTRCVVVKHDKEEEHIALVYLKEEGGGNVKKTQMAKIYKVNDPKATSGKRVEIEVCAGVDAALVAILTIALMEKLEHPQHQYVHGLVPHG